MILLCRLYNDFDFYDEYKCSLQISLSLMVCYKSYLYHIHITKQDVWRAIGL